MLTREREPSVHAPKTGNGRHAVLEAGDDARHVPAPNKAHAPALEPAALPRNILIVEDDELTRRQLQQLLQADPNLSVEVIGDGKQALERLTENTYSIVVTDLRMPRCDGMDLIREIEQRRLPVTVIVTTGHGSRDRPVSGP